MERCAPNARPEAHKESSDFSEYALDNSWETTIGNFPVYVSQCEPPLCCPYVIVGSGGRHWRSEAE